jgi:hypothetical protein
LHPEAISSRGNCIPGGNSAIRPSSSSSSVARRRRRRRPRPSVVVVRRRPLNSGYLSIPQYLNVINVQLFSFLIRVASPPPFSYHLPPLPIYVDPIQISLQIYLQISLQSKLIYHAATMPLPSACQLNAHVAMRTLQTIDQQIQSELWATLGPKW